MGRRFLAARRRGMAGTLALLMVGAMTGRCAAAEWQWSVADGAARAYLWIPPECTRVRAVMVANHNMIEGGILEHAAMRKTLAAFGIAQVWVVPALEGTFDFHATGAISAVTRFERVMEALAEESGYGELATAPVAPIGHSACASYPWNFAAWSPERTLAVLSVKGDAPNTNRTGNGRPRMDWGERRIDGVPGLMVMGEFEWAEDRIDPAFEYLKEHPGAAVSVVCDAGRGHFDSSDRLVEYLALFVKKAAEARLPATGEGKLRPVDPQQGWRMDRWRRTGERAEPAACDAYKGEVKESFWCFDEEMARATEALYAPARGKKPQLVGFVQGGKILPQVDAHEQVRIAFEPLEDGVTFRVAGAFMEAVPGGSKNPAKWAGLPAGAPLGHAAEGRVEVTRITGPVVRTGKDTFAVALDRTVSTADRRNLDGSLLAEHAGDGHYKSAVQQGLVRIVPNTVGAAQTIEFEAPGDQVAKAGVVPPVRLRARTGAGLPVRFYVREGPAEVEGETLKFTGIPPRTKYPIKVTVVAWQWGRGGTGGGGEEPRVKTADPVERTFSIVNGRGAGR